MTKRRSTRLINQKKKKLRQQASDQNDTASRLSFVVELEASTVSDYLSTADISALLQACSSEFSQEFVNSLSLRAPDRFAEENKTHLGRHCACDWLRRLDGFYHSTKCGGEEPFNVNMAMQILRTPRGLHALGLAERLLRPFCVKNSRGEDMFAPVVCLLSDENESIFTQLDVTKAMNRVCDGAGSRFFYKFSTKRKSYSMTDFIDEHWDEIDGSSCRHCDRLPSYRDNDHSRIKWRDKNIESIRANCSKVYRPLKAGMERELQFVRYIPKPHKSGWSSKYNGLVAGVSTSGVFCVLELGAASVWRFQSLEEVSRVIQAAGRALSHDLVDSVALKAVDAFAVENKSHLGGECKCDWMRNLHFATGLEARNKCHDSPPFSVNKTLPVLQTPGSTAALLAALLITKELLGTVSWANRFVNPAYYPVVCPLLAGGGQNLKSKAAVTRAMNAVSPGAGSHFFYKVSKATGSARSPDFLYEHWDGIDGMSCQYCDQLVVEEDGRWTSKEIDSIRANCKKLYRPLRLKYSRICDLCDAFADLGDVFAPYKGLVAGITSDGVLCGLYLNIGFTKELYGLLEQLDILGQMRVMYCQSKFPTKSAHSPLSKDRHKNENEWQHKQEEAEDVV